MIHTTTVIASALALLFEERLTPPDGQLVFTVLILWAPTVGYLVLSRRLESPPSIGVPIAVVALGVASLATSASMATDRIASLFAVLLSLLTWTLVAKRAFAGEE